MLLNLHFPNFITNSQNKSTFQITKPTTQFSNSKLISQIYANQVDIFHKVGANIVHLTKTHTHTIVYHNQTQKLIIL